MELRRDLPQWLYLFILRIRHKATSAPKPSPNGVTPDTRPQKLLAITFNTWKKWNNTQQSGLFTQAGLHVGNHLKTRFATKPEKVVKPASNETI
jgi:hypothetical protein